MTITNGSELRDAREAAGLTQRELATLLRMSSGSANHIGKIENGRATLYGPMAVACEYLLGKKTK
jgi:transcriptional regulator with XRE-family HTH domain